MNQQGFATLLSIDAYYLRNASIALPEDLISAS